MTAKVNNVYNILDQIKSDAMSLCEDEGLSPLLMWILIRQQADHELLKLQHQND